MNKFFTRVDTLAHEFEQDLTKLWQNDGPKAATVASTVLVYAGPVLEDVVAMEGGPGAAAAVTAVVNKAEVALLAANKLLTTIGPKPSVLGVINGAASNLQGLLGAAQVKNPAAVANVTMIVNELQALTSQLAAIPPTPQTPQDTPTEKS